MAEHRTVPPVKPVGIAEHIGYLQGKGCPQRPAKPVDTIQRHGTHEAEVFGADKEKQQHREHHSVDKQIHVGPVIVVHDISGGEVGNLHAAQYQQVQVWEEHGEVALGRHPQLNVRHTLKGALNLCHTADEAHRPQQRQTGDVGSHDVAHKHHSGRCREQRLVGEAELHAEQYREIERHPAKHAVHAHQNVLAHQCHAANHLVERAEIHSARQLKRESHQYV